MKYRIVKRAKGWVVQSRETGRNIAVSSDLHITVGGDWTEVSTWRFRFLASLHLLWLRERARK